MRIFRTLDEVPPDFGPSALTIGNFDGVHAAHRRILRRVKEVAIARGLKASALTDQSGGPRAGAPPDELARTALHPDAGRGH